MKYDQGILRSMSFLELIGAIFVRSQLIEQIMRELILAKKFYAAPRDFDKKTFGRLLSEFVKLYPDIKNNEAPEEWKERVDFSLYSSLNDAKEIRNDAAHGEYLTHITIKDLMPNSQSDGIDRLTMKATRKNAEIMDEALIKIWNYRANLK